MLSKLRRHPAWPYCLPFILSIVFIALRDLHPRAVYVLYPLQTLAVGGAILWGLKKLPSLRPDRWLGSIGIGILGVVLWVGLDHLWINHGPTPGGFNPWIFDSSALAIFLLACRLLGATLVIPIMEEVFWRGFMMRYLIQEEFEKVPLGTYRPLSFFATTIAFAGVHGSQWSLGIVVGLLFGGWFVWSKNLGNIIVAHGLTNFLLGIYVISTKNWWLW